MKEKVLEHFSEKGYLRIAAKIYFTIAIFLVFVLVFCLFKGRVSGAIFSLGFAMIFYACKLFLVNIDKKQKWKKYEKTKIIVDP